MDEAPDRGIRVEHPSMSDPGEPALKGKGIAGGRPASGESQEDWGCGEGQRALRR